MNFRDLMQPVRFTGRPKAGDGIPAPLLCKGNANRRLAALREARDILAVIPGPGESLHAIMTGRYDLTDLVDVLLEKLGTAAHLRIATLSFNRHNVELLTSWLEAGRVKRLTMLCSLFFREHNPETFEGLRQTLGPPHRLAAARNHCKVCCFDFAGGHKLALEGSANLRTNSNREQFCLVRDAALHDWHAQWIDDETKKHAGDDSPSPAKG